LKVWIICCGMEITIPTKIIIEIPFPIPCSVIRSPSQSRNIVPAVRVMIVVSMVLNPGAIAPPRTNME